jgi:hypothetical protein
MLLHKVHNAKKYSVLPHTKARRRISWSFWRWKHGRDSSSTRGTLRSLLSAIKLLGSGRSCNFLWPLQDRGENSDDLKSWYIYWCVYKVPGASDVKLSSRWK